MIKTVTIPRVDLSLLARQQSALIDAQEALRTGQPPRRNLSELLYGLENLVSAILTEGERPS